jgi:hypothetical protein
MESDELIAKMRRRVEQYRRLAKSISDKCAAGILTQMADEGDADIKRFLAESVKSRIS